MPDGACFVHAGIFVWICDKLYHCSQMLCQVEILPHAPTSYGLKFLATFQRQHS